MNGLSYNYNFVNQHYDLKPILDIIFEETKYFTREEILTDLLLNIEYWKIERENVPLYVILDTAKIGSEYYYYYTLKDFFPEHKLVIDNYPENIEDGSEILYMDDWVLTGTHVLNQFNRFLQYDEYDEYYPRYPDRKLKLTVIVSIISNEAMTLVNLIASGFSDSSVVSNFYYTNIVRRFSDILNDYIQDKNLILKFFLRFCGDQYLENFYSNIDHKKVLLSDIPNYGAYAVHLDYKIANIKSSFPLIYEQCRVELPSKEFMIETIEYFTSN